MSLPRPTTLVLIAILCALGACNTLSGMGRDIESVGGALDNTAQNTKRKM